MAEDHGRDVAVVQMLFRFVVKQAFGETTACGHGDRRQLNGAGIIAHRVDARHVGVLEFINDDVPFIVGFNARCRQIEVVGRRFAANRPDQAVNGLAAAIFQLQRQAAVGILHHRFRDRIGMQLRPSAFITSTRVSTISGSKLRSGACLRTNRWVSAPRPLITPASSTAI